MLRLLFPARSVRVTRPAPTRRARLGLEELGVRYTPSDGFDEPAGGMGGGASQNPGALPSIQDFRIDVTSGVYTMSGRVANYTPGMTITVSGGSLHGQQLTIAADGTFSATFTNANPGANIGVQLRDANGNLLDSEYRPCG